MDIFSYAGFAYGLTAIISLGTVGVILMINSLMNWAVRLKVKQDSQEQTPQAKLAEAR